MMTNTPRFQRMTACIALSVLLIAHGSRRAEANDDLVELARLVSERGGYEIRSGRHISNWQRRRSSTVGRACVEQAATRILMLPYFLSAGVHVAQDLEEARKQLSLNSRPSNSCYVPIWPAPTDGRIVLDRLREAHVAQASSL